jgi:hypothetical protein
MRMVLCHRTVQKDSLLLTLIQLCYHVSQWNGEMRPHTLGQNFGGLGLQYCSQLAILVPKWVEYPALQIYHAFTELA